MCFILILTGLIFFGLQELMKHKFTLSYRNSRTLSLGLVLNNCYILFITTFLWLRSLRACRGYFLRKLDLFFFHLFGATKDPFFLNVTTSVLSKVDRFTLIPQSHLLYIFYIQEEFEDLLLSYLIKSIKVFLTEYAFLILPISTTDTLSLGLVK